MGRACAGQLRVCQRLPRAQGKPSNAQSRPHHTVPTPQETHEAPDCCHIWQGSGKAEVNDAPARSRIKLRNAWLRLRPAAEASANLHSPTNTCQTATCGKNTRTLTGRLPKVRCQLQALSCVEFEAWAQLQLDHAAPCHTKCQGQRLLPSSSREAIHTHSHIQKPQGEALQPQVQCWPGIPSPGALPHRSLCTPVRQRDTRQAVKPTPNQTG